MLVASEAGLELKRKQIDEARKRNWEHINDIMDRSKRFSHNKGKAVSQVRQQII